MKKKILFLITVLFFYIINLYAQDSSKIFLNRISDSIKVKSSEKNLLNAINNNFSSNGDEKQRDSLYKIVKKLYPKGRAAAYLYLLNVLMGTTEYNEDMNLSTFINLPTRFSEVNFNNESSSIYEMYDQIRYLYFGNFIDQDSTLTMQKVYPSLKTHAKLNSVAWYLSNNSKHLLLAQKLIEEALDKNDKEFADSLNIPQNQRENWKINSRRNYAFELDTYAHILSKEGEQKRAIDVQKKALQLTNLDDPSLNNGFINILITNKDFTEAVNFGEKIYLSGKGDKETEKLLDSLFVIQNPNKNSGLYLKDLEKRSMKNKMLDIEGPSFSLKDLNGNIVNSTDLKDKIVILDFWATWCGPCKASFPGMQLAVNKYKNNKNIVFLFVDTFERFSDPNQRTKSVASVMKSMKLDFQVLLDKQKESQPNIYELASQLNFNSIPTKFILKDGKIKFKLIGYAGSDEAVLKEIDDYLNYLM